MRGVISAPTFTSPDLKSCSQNVDHLSILGMVTHFSTNISFKICNMISESQMSTSLSLENGCLVFSEREGQKLDGVHKYRFSEAVRTQQSGQYLNQSGECFLEREWMKTSQGKNDFLQTGKKAKFKFKPKQINNIVNNQLMHRAELCAGLLRHQQGGGEDDLHQAQAGRARPGHWGHSLPGSVGWGRGDINHFYSSNLLTLLTPTHICP